MPPTSTYRQVRGTSAHHTGPHAPNLQLPPGPGHQCPPHRPPCPQPPATARSGAPVPTTPAPMPPTSRGSGGAGESVGQQAEPLSGLHDRDADVVGAGGAVELAGRHQRAALLGQAPGEGPGEIGSANV